MKVIPDDALGILTVWQEARGEPYQGKVAVAEVIRNRMSRNYSSDGTVAGTVCRPYQFSGWNFNDPNLIKSLKIDDTDPVVIECARAWCESAKTNHTKGAVLYCNLGTVAKAPSWAKVENRVAVIGQHSFFID